MAERSEVRGVRPGCPHPEADKRKVLGGNLRKLLPKYARE